MNLISGKIAQSEGKVSVQSSGLLYLEAITHFETVQ